MRVLVFVVSLAFSVIPRIASATVINFAGFANLTVLTTQDFGDGVTFSGAQILTCCASDGSGSLNNTQYPPPADDGGSTDGVNVAFNPSGTMTLTFTSPSAFFSAAFTYNDGLTVQAFNSASMLIDTVNGACGANGSGGKNLLGSGCGAPDEVVNITTGGISKIVIAGGATDNFTIDDVNFSGAINAGSPGGPSTSTPEPGTFTLLVSGIIGLAAFVRRRGISHAPGS